MCTPTRVVRAGNLYGRFESGDYPTVLFKEAGFGSVGNPVSEVSNLFASKNNDCQEVIWFTEHFLACTL